MNRYWLNAEPDDPEAFSQQVKLVCQLYEDAPTLYDKGVHIVSTDEMTGIQALERKHPSKPMRPGKVKLVEFEYIRHGTQSLIANWEVALGQVITSSIGPTRNEYDFANHISNTIETDPEATWVFIVDQLNTHKSASLVRLVAACCQLDIDLGVKEKSGILESMATREEFLSNPEHRIRFVYIPKHTSWLNQIEIWFSILVRRLLKHASFKSTDELKVRIEAFINYFNQTMAKPFQWKYKSYPQAA